MKKRPFYKAIQGTWSRAWLFMAIILVSGLLHYSSLTPVVTLQPTAKSAEAGEGMEEPVHRAADVPVSTAEAFVNLSINDGRYQVFNHETNELVATDQVGSQHFDLPPGTYRLEFAKVPGYAEPKTSIFTLVPQEKKFVNCEYNVRKNVPTLHIKVAPPNGAYRIYNSANAIVLEATGPQMTSLPEGKYRIEFLDIPGFASLGIKEFNLYNRVTTTIEVLYNPIK